MIACSVHSYLPLMPLIVVTQGLSFVCLVVRVSIRTASNCSRKQLNV